MSRYSAWSVFWNGLIGQKGWDRVWRDPELGLLRMWCCTGHRTSEPVDWRNVNLVCHAVSVDGITWRRLPAHVHDYWGSRENKYEGSLRQRRVLWAPHGL